MNSTIKTSVNSPSEAGALHRARGWADGPRLTPSLDVRLPEKAPSRAAGGSSGGKGQGQGGPRAYPGRGNSPKLWWGRANSKTALTILSH